MLVFVPLLNEGNCLIRSDPVQPGVQPGIPFKTGHSFKRLDESVLDDVVRIVVIGNEPAHMPVQSLLILLYEHPESALLAFPIAQQAQDLSIRLFLHSSPFAYV